ncbi:MAG: hypothetical protein AAFV33_03590 [Chloroflexota bacterium]
MSNLIENARKDIEVIEDISLLDSIRLKVPWSNEGIEVLDEFTYKTELYRQCKWEDLRCVHAVFAEFLEPGTYYLRYFTPEEIFQDFDLWLHVKINHPTSWIDHLWKKGKNIAIISENLDFHLHATENLNSIDGSEINIFKGQSM